MAYFSIKPALSPGRGIHGGVKTRKSISARISLIHEAARKAAAPFLDFTLQVCEHRTARLRKVRRARARRLVHRQRASDMREPERRVVLLYLHDAKRHEATRCRRRRAPRG